MLGVTFVKEVSTTEFTFGAYTDKLYFLKGTFNGGLKLISTEPNPLGMVPIIEYQNNSQRQGSFETVISLLDALNTATSDRLNGLAQHIQEINVV